MNHYSIGQRAILTIDAHTQVFCTVAKISITATRAWYGVRVDNGIELHGIDEEHLSAVQ